MQVPVPLLMAHAWMTKALHAKMMMVTEDTHKNMTPRENTQSQARDIRQEEQQNIGHQTKSLSNLTVILSL